MMDGIFLPASLEGPVSLELGYYNSWNYFDELKPAST